MKSIIAINTDGDLSTNDKIKLGEPNIVLENNTTIKERLKLKKEFCFEDNDGNTKCFSKEDMSILKDLVEDLSSNSFYKPSQIKQSIDDLNLDVNWVAEGTNSAFKRLTVHMKYGLNLDNHNFQKAVKEEGGRLLLSRRPQDWGGDWCSANNLTGC